MTNIKYSKMTPGIMKLRCRLVLLASKSKHMHPEQIQISGKTTATQCCESWQIGHRFYVTRCAFAEGLSATFCHTFVLDKILLWLIISALSTFLFQIKKSPGGVWL